MNSSAWVRAHLSTATTPKLRLGRRRRSCEDFLYRIKETLEGNHGEVRWNPEIHLPEGPIALLGGEDMMSHRLDIPEATFQRAGGSKRRRSRDAASEFHRLDCAAHRICHPQQQRIPSADVS